MPGPKKVSSPIRIDPELEAKIEEAARLTGFSKADVMRLAMRIGLEDLRRINYDLPSVVLDAAKPASSAEKTPVKYQPLRGMKPPKVEDDEGKGNAGA